MGKKLYNMWNPKKGRFHQATRNHNLIYKPIAYKGNKIKFSWDDFKHFYILITSFPWLELYAFDT